MNADLSKLVPETDSKLVKKTTKEILDLYGTPTMLSEQSMMTKTISHLTSH